MSVTLPEDHMGHDAQKVGFPNLLVCMAFLARTDSNELWGVHLTTADPKQTFWAFWGWAQGKGLTTDAITEIYGCCNRRLRYGGSNPQGAWVEEMEWCARELGGWRGVVSGFDTGVLIPQDGAYVEFVIDWCKKFRIFYKQDTDMREVGIPGDDAGKSVRKFRHAEEVKKETPPAKWGAPAFGNPLLIGDMMPTAGDLQELDYALRLNSFPV